jgi:hypothetical protein
MTLTLTWHLSRWSNRLAFDDLAYGGDDRKWRCEEIVTITGINLNAIASVVPAWLSLKAVA